MITFFAVVVIAAIIMLTFLLLAGWLINRPDTGKRAKPAGEDQRTVTAWLAGEQHTADFWPAERRYRRIAYKNVSRAGRPQSECSDGQLAAPAPAAPTSATSPGPGHHHASGQPAGKDGTCPHGGPVEDCWPHSNKCLLTSACGGEACEPCTVHGCPAGCKCACHWGEHTADLTALLAASDDARTALYDAGAGTDDLIARAGRVLAGASA